jgi:hypothetical protein
MPFIVVVDEYDTHPERMRSMWPRGLRGVGSELGVEGRCRRALSRPVVSGDANARLVLGTASGRIASQEQAMTSNREIYRG